MNCDGTYPYYSKYRPETMAMERSKLAQVESEIHQEKGRDIMKDDLLNLKITLGTCDTVEQLLEVL